MYYLYASKPDGKTKLVATFDSEAQLLSYVRWATLRTEAGGGAKFEQGSVLAGGYERWNQSATPLTDENPLDVIHNPSPSML